MAEKSRFKSKLQMKFMDAWPDQSGRILRKKRPYWMDICILLQGQHIHVMFCYGRAGNAYDLHNVNHLYQNVTHSSYERLERYINNRLFRALEGSSQSKLIELERYGPDWIELQFEIYKP